MEVNYEFLKSFTAAAKEQYEKTGKMPECEITVFAPVKVKKGTKNNPSPFYDRNITVNDEEERYTLYARRHYGFLYGDRYEDHVEEGHVFREVNEGEEQLKTKPDTECPMLSLNRSGKYCVDIVAPKKIGQTEYFLRVFDENGDPYFNSVGGDSLLESINQWKPTHNGEYKEPIFKQFSLQSVIDIKMKTDTEELTFGRK